MKFLADMGVTFKSIAVGFLGLIFSSSMLAQQEISDTLAKSEVYLSEYLKNIARETSAQKRDSLSNLFNSLFQKVLSVNGSMDYSFDSLVHVGKLTSENRKVRVYTWNIPQAGGYQNYHGYIQIREDNGEVKLFELKDGRRGIKDPTSQTLSCQNWMAALYYQIAGFSAGQQEYYVLLGFDFNNLFTSKKIIEVLSVDKDGNPTFGLPIFNVDDKILLSRVVFEFSARAVVTLKYLPNEKVIVFDHLSPSRPEYAGELEFYGPDSSFDGFRFEDGGWVYVRDLDLRNPRRPVPKSVSSPENIKEPDLIYKPLYGKPG